MGNVGAILGSIATLIVCVGTIVVLLKVAGLISALSQALGPRKEEGTEVIDQK